MAYCHLHQWESVNYAAKVRNEVRFRLGSNLKVTCGFGHVQCSYLGFTVLVQKGRMALDDVWGHLARTFTGAMLIKIKYDKLCFPLFISTHRRLSLGLVGILCRRNKEERWPLDLQSDGLTKPHGAIGWHTSNSLIRCQNEPLSEAGLMFEWPDRCLSLWSVKPWWWERSLWGEKSRQNG